MRTVGVAGRARFLRVLVLSLSKGEGGRGGGAGTP